VPTEAASAHSRRPAADLLRLSRIASRLPVDVFLFPSVYTWFPVFRRKTVVGVHDVIADELPELTLPSRGAEARWRLKRSAAVRRATRVFTVSEASRRVVAKMLGLSADTIAVVPEAPDPVFGSRSPEAIAEALTSAGLEPGQPFLVYAGGISPHKGLATLLDAFASLPGERPRLVIAGALEDEEYLSAAGDVRRRIDEHDLGGDVVLTGHVSDEVLAGLYAGALAFVSPSMSEGFGLPAVEAAASGTAVVLSDIPAYRETLGDAALFFPVGDFGALAGRLAAIVADPALRDRQAQACQARVKDLSWVRAAQTLHGVLTEAVRG
jgi:glycosyltransferase involved in cell wall biosynthesis